MNLNNLTMAADTTAMEAGDDTGMFSTVGKFAKYGVAAAATSGIVSLLNTGIFYKNKIGSVFGAEESEELDTAEILDQGSASMGEYYRENKNVLDTVGFVGASFIPGMMAVKGVRLAQAGKAAGSFKYAGLVPARAQERALVAGLKELAVKGPSVFETVNRAKRASLAWGVADNVLQAAAFETAAAVALYRSPTLKDESLGDIAWDLGKNILLGGAIGGAVEGLITNGIFKNASRAIEGKLRKVDTITALEGIGLGAGDEAFATIDAVVRSTRNFIADPVSVKYRINGAERALDLDVKPLAETAAIATRKKALEQVQAKMAYLVPGDPSVGRVFAKNLTEIAEGMVKAGADDDLVSHKMGEVLWGLKKAEGLGSDDVNFATDVYYLLPNQKIGSDAASLSQAITTVKPGKTAQAYAMRGNWNDVKGGTLGIKNVPGDLGEAWRLGFDIVLDPVSKKLEINPASEIFKKINPKSQDELISRVYQPRTHTSMDDAIPYMADLATQGKPLEVLSSGVVAGKRIVPMAMKWTGVGDDVIKATARHLWIDQHVTSLKGVTVAWDDFSVWNKILENPKIADGAMLKMADGRLMPIQEMTNIYEFALSNKVLRMEQMLAENASMDHRVLTGILGTEPQFVEKLAEAGGDWRKMADAKELAFRPLATFAERENIILSYSKASMDVGPDFIDGMRAYQSRVKEGMRATEDAVRAILPKEILDTMPDFAVNAKQADSLGAGPTMFGFSNADYTDPLRAYAQASGQWLQNASAKIREMKLTELQSSMARIQASNDPSLGAVLTFARQAKQALALDPASNKIVDADYLYKLKKAGEAAAAGKPMSAEGMAAIRPAIEIELNDNVADMLRTYHAQHAERVSNMNTLRAAQGLPPRFDPTHLHLPPIDTRKTPFFAFVTEKNGRAFGTDEVSMITARNAEQLQTLVAQVKAEFPHFDVLMKSDTEDYYKALGKYEFNSGMNSVEIDSTLRKSGKLNNMYAPVMEPKAVIDEFVNYVGRAEDQVLRAAVSTKNAQLFAELEYLSKQNTKVASSKMGYLGRLTGKTIEDPFGDYKRLALNISKRAEYPIWQQMNEFVDALGTRAYEGAERLMAQAGDGKITWERANSELEKLGLTGPFKGEAEYFEAQLKGSGNLFRSAVAKANTLLATVGLRLDSANALVNVLSSPIMQASEISAIRKSIMNDPVLLAKFDGMRHVTSPDGKMSLPNIGKLYSGAMSSYFGANKAELLKRYTSLGVIKDDVFQFHAMLDDLALMPTMKDPSQLMKLVDKAVEKGAKYTGNNFAEQFTRFVSADMMRQLTDPVVEAGKMGAKEQDAMIRIFVNRTQGNYVASQRPIAFQGTVGAAVSLFQTYAFNLYQQLFRHIENRDWRTVAVMSGMQSGLYGLNGLPMFDAINTHLIGTASINEGHRDAYSTITSAIGKDAGDWMMYGSLSAFPLFGDRMPALYTRGDLNPRHLTILPTSLADIPAVSVGTRILQSVQNFGQTVSAGGDVGASFLGAMEHNGMSRPLAGLAQVMQGAATTGKGGLISAHNDLLSVATAARIMGAKPMDDAIALNTKFRLEGYKAFDRDRIESLGRAVKQKVRTGTLTEEDMVEFAADYAARGGRIESYNAAMKRWTKDASQSVVNTMMLANKSAYGQRLMEVMGGDPLEEFAQQSPEQ